MHASKTRLLAASASFLLMAASSVSGTAEIKEAAFSDDFEEVTVTLSEVTPRAMISWQLFLNDNGLAWSSGSVEVRNDDAKVLRGFRDQIKKNGGTGKGTLEIRICPQDPKTMDITSATCGEAYRLAVDAGATGSFSDVDDASPHAQAIRYVHDEGIVAGYPDGTFQPDATINRAEFTKIVILSIASQESINGCVTSSFSDVSSDEWYARYLCHARDSALIGGYPDGTFKPAESITFAEAAKILGNAFGIAKSLPASGEQRWFEPFVRALEAKHAIPLTINRFDQKISRGQMAEMMYRLRAGVATKETATYDSLVVRQTCDQRLATGEGSCE